MRKWQVVLLLCGAAALAGISNIVEGKRTPGDLFFTGLSFALAGYSIYKINKINKSNKSNYD